jgi:hypothetical protein
MIPLDKADRYEVYINGDWRRVPLERLAQGDKFRVIGADGKLSKLMTSGTEFVVTHPAQLKCVPANEA